MRSDIMFEREAPPEISENERKGLELLVLAESAERSGTLPFSLFPYPSSMIVPVASLNSVQGTADWQ
jgi:hypothetical protein